MWIFTGRHCRGKQVYRWVGRACVEDAIAMALLGMPLDVLL